MLSPGGPRETPTQARAAELGLKIGTLPTAILSPVAAATQAASRALAEGRSEADDGLSAAEFRATMGYDAYEAAARNFAR